MKKKILHIAAHLGAGVGKATSGLAIGLKDYYHNEILLLEEPENKRYVTLCEEHDVNVQVVSCVSELKEKIEQADCVIFSWWGHPLSRDVYLALQEVSSRVIIWTHVNGLYYPFISVEFLDLFDGVLLSTTCTYENDKWTKEQIVEMETVAEIVYGSGLFYSEKIRAKENYGRREKIVVGYSGTINYNKMSPEFPKICSEIRKRVPNVLFKFYGVYDEDTYNTFIRYDEELKDCMCFEGFVQDIDKRLLDVDVYCYPLNKENFGSTDNVLVEAMAAGLPIVVYNNPAERSVITHQETGLVADTTELLVQYVVKLCEDVSLAELLGRNAHQAAKTRFDVEANAKKCAEYIDRHLKYKKRKHNFSRVIGESAGENYLYFVNMTKEKYIEKAKKGELLTILRGETKGSLKHYLNYYSDEILEELKNVQGV